MLFSTGPKAEALGLSIAQRAFAQGFQQHNKLARSCGALRTCCVPVSLPLGFFPRFRVVHPLAFVNALGCFHPLGYFHTKPL